MSTLSLGILAVGSAVFVAVLGLLLARRTAMFRKLGVGNEADSAVFKMVGTLYAVSISFAIVVVWGTFRTTATTVSMEANALADTEQMSRGFPVPVRRQVREAARTYCQLVIGEEWDAMERGGSSARADAVLVELWQIYTGLPDEHRGDPLYSQSLARINEISTNRRLRLLASDEGMPKIMWILMGTIATVVIVLSYGFPVSQATTHAIMTGVLTGVIALSLFLVSVLEGPFRGEFRVSPEPFEFVLDGLQDLDS